MPLSLLNHSALVLFAQRTRIPTSARSIGFRAIWICISSSSGSSALRVLLKRKSSHPQRRGDYYKAPQAIQKRSSPPSIP